jgi:hypothetical protein
MRKIYIAVLILTMACSKHKDPGFSSAEGKWGYTTVDGKIAVTFVLAKSSAGVLTIQSQTITVDGTLYNSASQMTDVSLPAIEKIRINANDAKAVYPFEIIFNKCTVSADFKTISFTSGSYTFPYPMSNNLTVLKISRQ